MRQKPYHITHHCLSGGFPIPAPDTQEQGHYFIFWWKSIPLGQLFIHPGQRQSEKHFWQQAASAIAPAVQQYARLAHPHTQPAPWQQWLEAQQFTKAASFFEEAFAAVAAPELPAQVPVSILICTRNRPAHLQQCLHRLQQLSCRPQEIVVIDNAPSDNRTQEVVQQFKEVRYCREARAGLDIARNTGIRQADCPIVAFLDDDVVAHPLWVYRVWEAFQQPEVAAITGLVIAAELQTEAQQIFEQHWSFNRGYINKVYDQAYFEKTLAQGPPVWEIGAGANMAFRKAIFEQAGYFNELLDVGAAGCNGDSEMWFRILAAGHSIRYAPLAVVHHEHRKEMAGLQKQIFYYMRGFAAAALLQQQLQQQAGYKNHLLEVLPPYYLKLLRQGFPRYPFRYRTLGAEIKGLASGVLFYLRNKHQLSVK